MGTPGEVALLFDRERCDYVPIADEGRAMSCLDQKSIEKLANVCGRLASCYEGERSNADVIASRMIGELGLDWRTLIKRAFAPPVSAQRPARRFTRAPTDEEAALDVYRQLLAQDWLNAWERSFLESLLQKEAVSLSNKQQNCLRKILNKYRAAAAKAGCSHAAA